MVCSICKGSDHNRRTCLRRQIAKAAEEFKNGTGEGIKESYQEEVTTKVENELAKFTAEEIACDAAELVIDCLIPGLGLLIKVTRHAYKASTFVFVKK